MFKGWFRLKALKKKVKCVEESQAENVICDYAFKIYTFYRVRTLNCHPHIFMIYTILLFRLHKCNLSLDSYKNKVITSVV